MQDHLQLQVQDLHVYLPGKLAAGEAHTCMYGPGIYNSGVKQRVQRINYATFMTLPLRFVRLY